MTFERDSRFFYAALSSGGAFYLVTGDAELRCDTVIREGAECPSLSPNQTLIAFTMRQAVGGGIRWNIAVLDLATGAETLLTERNSVDDGLDDRHVLYARPSGPGGASSTTDVRTVQVGGGREPELLLSGVYSPAVLR